MAFAGVYGSRRRGAPVDGQLRLELGDAPTRRDQLPVLAAGHARRTTGVDQVLPAPVVDRLVTDTEQLGESSEAPIVWNQRNYRR